MQIETMQTTTHEAKLGPSPLPPPPSTTEAAYPEYKQKTTNKEKLLRSLPEAEEEIVIRSILRKGKDKHSIREAKVDKRQHEEKQTTQPQEATPSPKLVVQPFKSTLINALVIFAIFSLMLIIHVRFQKNLERPTRYGIQDYPRAISHPEIEISKEEKVILSPEKTTSRIVLEQSLEVEEIQPSQKEVQPKSKPIPEEVIATKSKAVETHPVQNKQQLQPPKEEKVRKQIATNQQQNKSKSRKYFHDTYTSGGPLDLDNEIARQNYMNKLKIKDTKTTFFQKQIRYPTAPYRISQKEIIGDIYTPYNDGGKYDLDSEYVRQQYLKYNTYYTLK